MTGKSTHDGPWMEGDGAIPRKTNATIKALLAQDFTKFKTDTLDDAIEYVADVHAEDTIKEYRERVIKHGPFEMNGSPGIYEVIDDDD